MSDLDETNAIARMTDAELIAYRNIILMGDKCLIVTDDPDRLPRHLNLIEVYLRVRGIRFEQGKLIDTPKE